MPINLFDLILIPIHFNHIPSSVKRILSSFLISSNLNRKSKNFNKLHTNVRHIPMMLVGFLFNLKRFRTIVNWTLFALTSFLLIYIGS